LYDVTHYDLSIRLNLVRKTFDGSVLVTARALEPLKEILLHASNETLTIDSVKSGDRRRPFHHQHGIIAASLPMTAMSQETVSIQVWYHGISNFQGEYDAGGVFFSAPDRAATISEPNFARTWWPCKDHPSDKATVAVTITVPKPLTAVSNGLLMNTSGDDSTSTFAWRTAYPTATYLVSIAAADYRKITETYTGLDGKKMTVLYYVYPAHVEKARRDFESTTNILQFFARTFCEYPFLNEKLSYAEVDGDLTMENQTAISIQQSIITGDQTSESIIVHETAHQWWGNLLTPVDWRHTWLSEGFATYAEALYREFTYGRKSYDKYIEYLMSGEQGQLAGPVFGRSDTAFWDSFHPRVYTKGAIALHMLRGVVRDSLFFMIMRNYLNDADHRYGNVSTEDFIRECERGYGGNLRWFFDEWVFASTDSIDRPEYEYQWTSRKNDRAFVVRLDLTQTRASLQLFRMPMSVTVSTLHTARVFTVTDSLAQQSFAFTVEEQPIAVEIDTENYVFKILKKKEGD
jgi:aminopeptidase N